MLYTDLLDAKHLPHKVVLYYKPLSNAVHSLVENLSSLSHDQKSYTDVHLTQVPHTHTYTLASICSLRYGLILMSMV